MSNTPVFRSLVPTALAVLALAAAPASRPAQAAGGSCGRTVSADVVAIDQPYFWNRLGAVQPQGMIYALKDDVVANTKPGDKDRPPGPGDARLRDGKRPRPLVLRMNVGDCLTVTFTNWLHPQFADREQPRTREASVHVAGLQLVESIADDGSWVGKNAATLGGSSLAAPGQTKLYHLFAEREGTYLLHSTGALTGGEGDNGTISAGLFGAVNVEPANSIWYRSQVTRADLELAVISWERLERRDEQTGASWIEDYPILDYGRVYPPGHPRAGRPILKILDAGNEIVHGDLTAIIAGTGAGGTIVPNPYPAVAVYPNRNEPFREFTIIFHDEIGAVQAFPHFNDKDNLGYTLHSVRDAFAINYGTGGIGAEILANRLRVGPMHACTDCLYEEFFLASWAVGDPAMVVDTPANSPCTRDDIEKGIIDGEPGFCNPTPGAKATVAYFPDDPSNVYHSYLNDHVKFRNVLAGSDDHHIFHLHAHQWLHTPDSDKSTYLDSQAIGQGTSFTYEITHEGSGNRNKTPGDSIFHCHFYPHFAMGMWSMWRVHDVLETGTWVDAEGRPLPGARALPDGEIAAGTAIPAIVPLPGQPMPPPPNVGVQIVGGEVVIDPTAPLGGNPGYPFYIPGKAGHRPPHPPLDFYVETGGEVHDGGLPRHVVTGGTFVEAHTRLDFHKEMTTADALLLDEQGEPWERMAMNFHADLQDGVRDGYLETVVSGGGLGKFELNGADPSPGAPYADPCYGGASTPPPTRNIQYFAANIQTDVVFNTAGWHFPQQRFLSLWGDVPDFLWSGKPPEPFFFRGNTYDCIDYFHTNLVPKEYKLDDFQVRTPTDILGQHIHLVKFDVTSSDGSGNGFNYEDGTFSPEEVRGRIKAINELGGILLDPANEVRKELTAKPHPYFEQFGIADWLGAQTTVQRWYVDDVLDLSANDRTLRTVFTHDHFGPSTHQQTGLYAGLVVERAGSTWRDAETGQVMGGRFDGGPTSWQAVIEGPKNFREFLLEFGDFQHAYWPNGGVYPDPMAAINPPGRVQQWDQLDAKPWVYEKPALVGRCPNGKLPPCPEAIAADDPGTMVLNYRNEPLALRVKHPSQDAQAAYPKGDLSFAFSSDVHGDPFTPVLRTYEDDPVQIRILVGAHEEEHNFSVHGTRWLFEPADVNSGIKASQMMGISEHYEFVVPPLVGGLNPARGSVDFLYKAGSSAEDLWNGIWGLLRVYRGPRPDLTVLSAANPDATAADVTARAAEFSNGCPSNATPRPYSVAAVAARDVLPDSRLTYNPRTTKVDRCDFPGGNETQEPVCAADASGPLTDPTAILFVHAGDLDPVTGKLKPTAPIEPLILRALAGECVVVTLENRLQEAFDLNGYSLLPNIIDQFNQNQVLPSLNVGLHAQVVSYDPLHSDGTNVGHNPVQTVAPTGSRTYYWYGGFVEVKDGTVTGLPAELGVVPLYSSDPIKHSNKGAVGALVIEPKGATWQEYPGSRAKARVTKATTDPYKPGTTFREFVLVFQDDINLYYDGDRPVRPLAVAEDPSETGQAAFNYKTEPVWFRKGYLPETKPEVSRHFQFADSFANALIGGDPFTPVFHAVANEDVRFRVVHPGGDSQNHNFGLHGHVWQEEPYQSTSRSLPASGYIPQYLASNAKSEWKGVQYGQGPTNALDILLQNGAGGAFGVEGDYLWRDYASWGTSNGLWGLLRVHPTPFSLLAEEPLWNSVGQEETP